MQTTNEECKTINTLLWEINVFIVLLNDKRKEKKSVSLEL